MTERFPQAAAAELNLSVTGFAVTAPLVGEPLAGRHVFGGWRFAPVCPAGAKPSPRGEGGTKCRMRWNPAAEAGLGAPAIRLKNVSYAKASPIRGGGKAVRL